MSAPAFTPGPWITVHQPEDGGAFHIDSYAGLHIAQTIGGLVGEQANARLIAAAPALYEALLLAVDAMRAPLDDWKGVVERKALDAARAALAAATGEQP